MSSVDLLYTEGKGRHPGWDVAGDAVMITQTRPTFRWDARPHYADGAEMKEGDTIVLKANPSFGTLDSVHPADIHSYLGMCTENGSHHAGLDVKNQPPAVFRVHNEGGKLTLLSQDTGNPLSWCENWATSDVPLDENPTAASIGFDDQGHMYFEQDEEPLMYSYKGVSGGLPVQFSPIKESEYSGQHSM